MSLLFHCHVFATYSYNPSRFLNSLDLDKDYRLIPGSVQALVFQKHYFSHTVHCSSNFFSLNILFCCCRVVNADNSGCIPACHRLVSGNTANWDVRSFPAPTSRGAEDTDKSASRLQARCMHSKLLNTPMIKLSKIETKRQVV